MWEEEQNKGLLLVKTSPENPENGRRTDASKFEFRIFLNW